MTYRGPALHPRPPQLNSSAIATREPAALLRRPLTGRLLEAGGAHGPDPSTVPFLPDTHRAAPHAEDLRALRGLGLSYLIPFGRAAFDLDSFTVGGT